MKSVAPTLQNISKKFDNQSNRYFQKNKKGACDHLLLMAVICLAAFGLVMVYSSSYIYAQDRFGDGLYFFRKHCIFLISGFCLMTMIRFLNFRTWQNFSLPIFLFSLLLLAMTCVPGLGIESGGATRWLNIGFASFQPIEILKITLIIYMSAQFSKNPKPIAKIKSGFLIYLWPVALSVLICMIQPDFGSASLLIILTFLCFFMAGVKIRYLLGSALVAVPFFMISMWFVPYRKTRILAFFDPWADPQNSGFQIIQSFLAFFRGGLFGVGLGNSKEKVFYLPKAHNDFSIAVVGEELGFVGVSILLCTFIFVIYRGIEISIKTKSKFAALVASGFSILIGLEVFWSASVALGLLPTKGMNLPFVSSGGTSIISVLIAIGIILSISADSRHSAKYYE